jgi:hypothetical protein
VGADPLAAESEPEEPELDARDEDRDGRQDDNGREEAHEERRRAGLAVTPVARVIADEAMAAASHLQERWRDQDEADKQVLREELANVQDRDAQEPEKGEQERAGESRQAPVGRNVGVGWLPQWFS